MTNHPNRSKHQRGAQCIYRDMTARELDHAIDTQAELLAALKSLYSEFKAYRPDCFEAAERAELESPDMILDGNGNLHTMRGSTVVIVLGARRAVAKAEGR